MCVFADVGGVGGEGPGGGWNMEYTNNSTHRKN